MLFYKVLICMMCLTAVAYCEECVFDLKLEETQDIRFDLTRIQEHTVNDNNNLNSVTFKLCKINNQQKPTYCDGIISKICLIKNKVQEIDIGSRIKEIKLDIKKQLFMSLEGNTICEKNQKYKTEITFVCNKNISTDKVMFKRHSNNNCKYIVEWTSVAVCPVDDLDIWKVCEVLLPHSNYKFNLNPLRRINNYLVENYNRRFEVNICGRLNDNNKCGGNITTICDITDITKPKVYAVGFRNDKLYFDTESNRLKLIQHERATKNKSRRIEIVFKCNESITPEKTKPEFLNDQNSRSKTNDPNIAYFEVATSTVCLPRMISCEIFTKTANFNLKPLHKRKGNFRVYSDLTGGHFYINVCDYLNEYNEEIPTSCTAGKTSACYVDSSGKAISVGSSQIGPYRVGNSILLNYTEGDTCKNSRKWSTMVNFTCSDESQLKHISSNTSLCIHVLEWKTREACRVLLERKDLCMVTHPVYPKTVYDMSSFKNHKDFEVENENHLKLRFSICKPLDSPCNGNLDSAVCLLFNGKEINLGLFTQQIVFENGKIYMAMQGEKCVDFGPVSSTIVRFVCDYSDSKHIDYKMELKDCTFEIIVYTKNACSSASKVNCTVVDDTMKLQNIYDLSQLTKFNSNYEISISSKEKIVFNVCHSVINNDIDGVNCQFSSGICLVDRNHLSNVEWYKNLGDVSKSPYKLGNKIVLDMPYGGFNNGHHVSSRIEFQCSSQSVYPFLVNTSKIDNEYTYIIKWKTPLVCSSAKNKRESSVGFLKTLKVYQKKPIYDVSINGLTYNTYLYSKNDMKAISGVANGNVKRKVILTEEDQELEYTLTQEFSFIHNSSVSCQEHINDTEKIVFHFICGFELQKPKIEKNLIESCTTDVFNIDPDICDHKLECKTTLYDLTPIKGSYITMGNYRKYGKIKFYINLCTPGEGGIGGLMELHGKNYSIGYQESSPKDEGNTVEVIFEHGASCNHSYLPLKYSTKITFQCDSNEAKGYPLYQKSNDECTLNFLWKTSLLCHKKLVEFNSISCTASLKDYNKGFEIIKVLNMENILNTNKFSDKLTTNYQVNLCKPSVCLYESSNCSNSMKLYYDVVKKHLIARFDHFVYESNFKEMEIVIECLKSHEEGSLTDHMLLMGQTLIFYTYSKHVCCLDFTDLTNEEMCKNYLLSSISPIIIENTTVEYSKNNKSNLLNVYLNNSDPEDSILSSTSYTKSEIYIVDNNSTLQWNNSIKVKQVVTEYPIYTSGTVLLLATFITLALSFVWFYRCKILKKIRQYLYPSSSVRRRRSYHNL